LIKDLFCSICSLYRNKKQTSSVDRQKGFAAMGGIFSSPSPPPPPPPPPPPSAPVESAAELAEKAARERRRRAQGETIATSWRGVTDTDTETLGGAASSSSRSSKRLLGE
jgi:hypothetical protein